MATLQMERDTVPLLERDGMISDEETAPAMIDHVDLRTLQRAIGGHPDLITDDSASFSHLAEPPMSEKMDLVEPMPRRYLRDFDEVLIQSDIRIRDPEQITHEVIRRFNQKQSPITAESNIFGTRIDRDEYLLVSRNNRPQLVGPSDYKVMLKPTLTGTNQYLGTFKQTDLYFGAHGSHVVNVPLGKIALAWRGNEPIILAQGIHVIHDQNFRAVKKEHLRDLSADLIEHGIHKIFRIPPGKLAKAWIGTVPYILEARNEPYVFSDPTFKLITPFNQVTEGHIQHGNYHIIRIPKGAVALAWFGTTPTILEAREEPYIVNDPYFRVSLQQNGSPFVKSDAEVIIHGSIKRLMPRTGKVAITYNNGNLVTYGPSQDQKPILILSENHTFQDFLVINTQTMEFPSELTKERRRKNNNNSQEDVDYEIFRTSDGLPIGVKLLVVYEINNPDLTLHKLNKDQILPHIESLVVADMGMVIQNCSSVDFLKSNQTQARPTMKPTHDQSPSAPEFYEHLQDEVKNRLHDDFAEYGIGLLRLNIETPKILDKNIADKMAEFSLMNTQARAKEAVLDRNFNIAQQEASQKAKEQEIQQAQENANKVSIAQAELEAVRLRAEATKLEAEAKAAARLAEATAEAKAQKMLLEITKERGEIYNSFDSVLKYDLAQAQVSAMKGIQGMVISPDVAAHYYGLGFSLGGGRDFLASQKESKMMRKEEGIN